MLRQAASVDRNEHRHFFCWDHLVITYKKMEGVAKIAASNGTSKHKN